MATATRAAAGLSTTELAVLGLLTYGEHSGYEIKKAAEASVGYLWSPAKSHIYTVLPRLVAGGFATARRVAQQRRPDKQVYRITKQGREAFRDWLEKPVEERPGAESTFLLKLFFGAKMRKQAVVAHVERRRELAEEELAEYREIEQRIRGVEESYFGYSTLRWGIAQAEAWIRWADEILRELEGR
jgi:DNA-binding PadR family transcriptional regulator